MYYLVSLLIYILIVFLFILYLKKPDIIDKQQFKEIFTKEMMKGLTKSDVRLRKKRVKVLTFFQRVLYWIWFSSIIAMLVLPAVVLCIVRYYIIDLCFVPESALYIDLNSPSLLVFGAGSFLTGIPLLIAYSYLTNRGVIRKADLLYQLGSFQEYSKKVNIYISGILLIIGLPLLIIGFNSYRYFDERQIVDKSALSINTIAYAYSDINYIEHRIYRNDSSDYYIVIKNGDTVTINVDTLINEKFEEIINANNVEIKIRHVKPLLG